jgi:nitrogen-specific signal transduction histidine kinase
MAVFSVGLMSVYLGVVVVAVLTQAVVGYWVYTRHWDRDGSRWFLIMVGTGVLFGLPTVLFLLPIGATYRQAAYVLGAFAAVPNVGAFVVFVSKYTGNDLHRRRWVQGLFGVSIVAYLLLAPTNGTHHLLFADFTMLAEPFPYLAVERGPVFAAIVLLIQVPAGYAVYLMATHLLATRRRSGLQLALFIAGALSVMTLDALSLYTNLFPLEFSHASLGQFPFYLLMTVSLYRFDLLNVKPVARNTVVENLRDPVIVLDDRQRVVDYNGAATHVWPQIGDELPADFESACPALADVTTVPPTETDATEELSLPYDGQGRHYSVTVSAVSEGDDGGTGWCSILLRDITELQQSRWQLEKQNERLDQVASTISHDLRNPITVAESRLELMNVHVERGTVDDETEAKLDEDVSEVTNATGRMQDIINDILTIAREGKTVDETEPVSLSEAANGAWENVDTRAATLTVTDDRVFQADHSKLLTIFENLFRNALDHGPEDVSVTVASTDDGFTVRDDGPGVPETHRDAIFEYGYTTSADGTGLGLSIVKTMSESHGWTVAHDDGYDGGTRFVFSDVKRRDGRTGQGNPEPVAGSGGD